MTGYSTPAPSTSGTIPSGSRTGPHDGNGQLEWREEGGKFSPGQDLFFATSRHPGVRWGGGQRRNPVGPDPARRPLLHHQRRRRLSGRPRGGVLHAIRGGTRRGLRAAWGLGELCPTGKHPCLFSGCGEDGNRVMRFTRSGANTIKAGDGVVFNCDRDAAPPDVLGDSGGDAVRGFMYRFVQNSRPVRV